MDSQFGLMNVWNQGDFVTKAVAVLLIGMSLASWIVIVVKALDVIKYKRLAKHSQDFWHSEDFATALNKLGKDDSNPFRALALEGREAAAHHRNTKAHLHDALDVSDWITRTLRNSSTHSPRACKPASPCWPRWVPPRPSSACSARSGASTTH
jgi:biopolymer transport protein ExbB